MVREDRFGPPSIPNWNRVFAAIPDFAERLCSAVLLDNAEKSTDEVLNSAEALRRDAH